MVRVNERNWRSSSPWLGCIAIVAALGGPLAPGQVTAASGPAKTQAPQPGSQATAGPMVFQLHWYPQAQFAGYMMAQEKGFFRQQGLPNLKLQWSAAGDRPFERLAEGKTDFCIGWLADALVERDRGMRLVHLAQVFQQSSLMLVARRGSGIEKPQDFTGKRVGLWGGNFDVQATALFRKFAARPILVPQSTSMVPFLRGAVDVASAMYYNEYHKLIEAGIRPEDLRTFRFTDYGLVFPEDGIYCTERTRRERPEVCAGLVTACRRGWEYVLANELETLEVVMRSCRAENVRTNRNHQRWMLRSVREAMVARPDREDLPWGTLTEDAYAEVARLLADQGLIQGAPSYREFHRPAAAVRGTQE